MAYSIIGSGNVGVAHAGQFARSKTPVGIANIRGPGSLSSIVKPLGNTVSPLTLEDALKAVVLLAVPFDAHEAVAGALPSWAGKIVIDVTNAYGVPLAELDNLPSSTIVARSLGQPSSTAMRPVRAPITAG